MRARAVMTGVVGGHGELHHLLLQRAEHSLLQCCTGLQVGFGDGRIRTEQLLEKLRDETELLLNGLSNCFAAFHRLFLYWVSEIQAPSGAVCK